MKLTINSNPIINTFDDESFLFSILSTKKYSENWLCMNFTNIYVKISENLSANPVHSFVTFPRSIPCLKIHSIPVSFYKKIIPKEELLKSLDVAINENCYIYLYLDEFYLPFKKSYQKNHFVHDSLIYGINLKRQTINIFTRNNKGKLSIVSAAVNVFFDSFYSKFLNKNCDIVFYSPFFYKCHFDKSIFLNNIKNYCLGETPSTNKAHIGEKHDKYLWGIDTFEMVKKGYSMQYKEVNMVSVSKLAEWNKWHKNVCIKFHLKYSIAQMKYIELKFKVLIVLALKYNYVNSVCKKNQTANEITKTINEIIDMQKQCYMNIVKNNK